MVCKNCNKEISDDIKFCPYCGTQVESGKELYNSKENILLGKNELQMDENKVKMLLNNTSKKVWTIAGVLLCVIALVIAFSIGNNKIINLNKYITIEVEGYDTVGKASVNFDKNAFVEDYGTKLSYQTDNIYGLIYSPTAYVCECVDWSLSESENLTNGDTITLKWECLDDIVYNTFGYKLKYKDISYKVKGLEKVDTFNPFENIVVQFSGISPYGTVSIQNNMPIDMAANIYIEADKTSGLRMGDIITLKMYTKDGSDIYTYFVDAFGKIPGVIEMQQEVVGLGEYVSLFGQISEETIESMKQQATDAYVAYSTSWSDSVTLTSMEYQDAYLLSKKGLNSLSYKNGADNYVVLVYKVNAHIKGKKYNKPYEKDVTYYTAIKYKDISVVNGTSQVDLNTYNITSDRYKTDVYYGTKSYDYVSYYFYGYETLDILFNKQVNAYLDEYTYEGSWLSEAAALPN